MPSSLELQNAELGYSDRALFRDISLSIPQGQWVCLLGPNGSGKTTFLRALLGALPLRRGRRLCPATRLGYVPQRLSISQDNSVTVQEFLNLRAAPTTPLPLIDDLGLKSFWHSPLRLLSGGQLKRTLLAFALWNDPEVLFLDEYLEGLDVEGVSRVMGYLEMLHSQKKITVVEVSHDISSVIHVAERVILLKDFILYDGSPKDHGFHECMHSVYGHHHWIRHDH